MLARFSIAQRATLAVVTLSPGEHAQVARALVPYAATADDGARADVHVGAGSTSRSTSSSATPATGCARAGTAAACG